MSKFFALDSLNLLFMIVLVIVTGAVMIYQGKQNWKYYTIFTLFFLSMTGAILSSHLGLTWVFVEATTLTSAYLIMQHKTQNSLEATWKYVFLCSIGISLAFVGIILLLIGCDGVNSLAYSDLYSHATAINPFWLKLSFIFILIGFGTKVGLAPVHSWLPDAHAEAPSPVSAMLSATLLNSAFLVILRYYKLMELAGVQNTAKVLLLTMGFLSIFVTAVYVYKIANYKRMLAYSSIENMGIIAIGTALGGVAVFAAALHLVAHSLIKASFFLTSGNVLKLYKTKEVAEVKGIIEQDKITGWLWVICAMLIVAVPPSPIFISEFIMIKQMIVEHHYILCFVFMLLLTMVMFGIMRAVVKTAFGKSNLEEKTKLGFNKYLPQIVLLAAAIGLCVYCPKAVYDLIAGAAQWM